MWSRQNRQPVAVARPAPAPKIQQSGRNAPAPPRPGTTEVVTVPPEPTMVVTPTATAPETPVEQTPAAKTSVWHKLNPVHWFGSSTPEGNYNQGGVTPLTPIPEPVPVTNSSERRRMPPRR